MTSTIITMGPLGPPTTSLATLHNGGEYSSEELVNFCKDVGIKILNKTG
jgi:hypothetical protein